MKIQIDIEKLDKIMQTYIDNIKSNDVKLQLAFFRAHIYSFIENEQLEQIRELDKDMSALEAEEIFLRR